MFTMLYNFAKLRYIKQKGVEMRHDIIGKNGSYAELHGGVQNNHDGSFTMFATIQDDILFKHQYIGHTFEYARKHFKELVQKETDKYILGVE